MSQQDAEVIALSERLLLASYRGQAGEVIQLVNRGAQVAVTKYGRSPLHLASHKGHTEVVRILLQAGCNPDIEDDGGQTALHRASAVGNTTVIMALIQEGCSLDRQDQDGNTALHEASWHGFSQSVKLLVKEGANIYAKNKAGHTALHLACQNGHAKSLQVLLLGGLRPDIKNNIGDTCLHVAVRYNHVTVIKVLLGAVVSVNEQNQVGDAALHLAATLNRRKAALLLLEAGADIAVRNNAGQTALDQARQHDSLDVALLLLRASQVPFRSLRKRRDELKVKRSVKSVIFAKVPLREEGESAADNMHCCGQALRKDKGIKTEPKHTTGKKRERKSKEKPFLLDHISKRDKRPDKNVHRLRKPLTSSSLAAQPPHNLRAYQLYTLYRDKDGTIMQAPMNGCCCEPLIRKVENQLEATKELIKSEIHTVQEQMNSKLREIGLKSQLQIKALDKKTWEQVASERTECSRRIDQKSAQELLEEERRQAMAVKEIQRWCLLKVQDIEARLNRDLEKSERQPPAVETEGPPIPPEHLSCTQSWRDVLSGARPPSGEEDSGKYTSEEPLVSLQGSGGSIRAGEWDTEQGDLASGKHREMLISMKESQPEFPQMVRPKKQSLHQDEKELVLYGPGLGHNHISHVSRSSSPQPARERFCRRHCREQSYQRSRRTEMSSPGEPSACTSPLREHEGVHGAEDVRCFFEAVSAQMDRWCQIKVRQARWQVEQRARQDQATLLQRIAALEDELRLLRTGVRMSTRRQKAATSM